MAAMLIAGTAPTLAQPAGQARARQALPSNIYLFKGLAGIFSSGMIDLGDKLARRGIAARVESHGDYEPLAEELIQRYRAGDRRPIIIIGHSLGADAAGGMARRLNQHGIPVALLVTFGPLGDPQVTPNVARAINYYQSNSAWRGRMVPAPGFRGSLINVQLDNEPGINHFNIEKNDRLHLDTIAKISAIVGRSHKPSRPVAQSNTAETRAPAPVQPRPIPAQAN